MSTKSSIQTNRGRVITVPKRYTPSSPSELPPQSTTTSPVALNVYNRDRRRKIRIGSNGANTQLISIENEVDDDDDNDEFVYQPRKKTAKACSNPRQIEHEDDDNSEQFDEGSQRNIRTQRRTTFEQVQLSPRNDFDRSEEQEIENMIVDATSKSNTYSKRSNVENGICQSVRNDINDVYMKLNNSFNENMNKFEKRLNKLAAACISNKENFIERFKSSSNDGFQSNVDFEGVNLLDIYAKNYADYARQVLRILYTRDELCSSILPSSSTHYARKPLDKGRFALFCDALRNKYRISRDKFDEFFKFCLRRKLVDFLCDERKRVIRKQRQQFYQQYQQHNQWQQEL